MPTERITNGGFETGNFNGWTYESDKMDISSNAPHGGSYLALFNGGTPCHGGAQTWSMSQSANLSGVDEISLYIKYYITASCTYRTMYVKINGNVVINYGLGPNTWTKLTGDVSSYSGICTVELYWECDDCNNRPGIDDISALSSMYIISGNVKDNDGNNLNNATISLEDGTDYSTNTDINGNYYKAVNPDVYTVTASLAEYSDDSDSVDASSGDKTQNFILSPSGTITLGEHNSLGISTLGGTSLGKSNIPGLSIPSGTSLGRS